MAATLSIHANSLLKDHGILRLPWTAEAEIAPGIWRSNQPGPGRLARLAREGIRTVVNLRGRRPDCGSWVLEDQACRALGLRLIDQPISSRSAPSAAMIEALDRTFAEVDATGLPALLHCKSGADRAGLASALWLILRRGARVAEARKQLSLRFLHIRAGRTGVLDLFLDRYEAEGEARGISLLEWVRSPAYDDKVLTTEHRAGLLGNLIVDRILMRE